MFVSLPRFLLRGGRLYDTGTYFACLALLFTPRFFSVKTIGTHLVLLYEYFEESIVALLQ